MIRGAIQSRAIVATIVVAAACSDQSPIATGDDIPVDFVFTDITEESPDLLAVTSRGHPGWNTSDKYAPGVALADLDGDGNLDLVQPRNDATGPDFSTLHIFQGHGDGTFTEVTPSSWTESQPAIVSLTFDVDGDDDLDLFIGVDGAASRLYRNDGGFEFEDISASAGLHGFQDRVFAASAGDLDRDGDLDLYTGAWNASAEDHGDGTAINRILLNDGSGVFTELEDQAHCGGWATLATAITDFDGDGWLDIYVANDFFDDCLYENRGGEFVNIASEAGTASSAISAMGTALGDLDSDGRIDLLVTDGTKEDDSIGNAVFLNRGDMRFEKPGPSFGLSVFLSAMHGPDTMFGWGAGIRDFDLDGDADVHVATHITVEEVFYQQDRGIYRVSSTMMQSMPDADARGTAYGDIDNDGDIDIVVARRGDGAYVTDPQPLQVLRNDTATTSRSVRVEVPASKAPGALIRTTVAGRTQTHVIAAGSSYASSNPPAAIIGIGDADSVESVVVEYIDGSTTELTDLEPGARVIVAE